MPNVLAKICNSYAIPARAVWDLLHKPEGEGYKSRAAQRGVVQLF